MRLTKLSYSLRRDLAVQRSSEIEIRRFGKGQFRCGGRTIRHFVRYIVYVYSGIDVRLSGLRYHGLVCRTC